MAIIDTQDGYLYSSSLVKTSNILFWRIIALIEIHIGKDKLEQISKSILRKHARKVEGISVSPLGGKDVYLIPNIRDIQIKSYVYAEAEISLTFPMQGTPANLSKVLDSLCGEIGLKNVSTDEGRIILKVFLGGDYYPVRVPAKKGSSNGKGQFHYIAQCET